MADAVDNLKVGMPWEKGVFITPLVDTSRIKYMHDYVSDAVAHGGVLLNPNGNVSAGTLYRPSLVQLNGAAAQCRVYNEEQFGPVVPIIMYDDINVS